MASLLKPPKRGILNKRHTQIELSCFRSFHRAGCTCIGFLTFLDPLCGCEVTAPPERCSLRSGRCLRPSSEGRIGSVAGDRLKTKGPDPLKWRQMSASSFPKEPLEFSGSSGELGGHALVTSGCRSVLCWSTLSSIGMP